ncbi:MAG TPA: carbohydrate ABC transporter permease [Acidimicrobiales bacterium]
MTLHDDNGLFRNARRVYRASGAALIFVLFFIPIAYAVMISLESGTHFLNHPLVPQAVPTFQNFSAAWSQGDLGPELLNTILYSFVAAGISTALSVLLAFPISRALIKGSSALYRSFVIGICLPLPIIPLFVESRMLHLFDNRLGYIILHVEVGIPLGVLLLGAFIGSIPKELDEAAWLDGAGYLKYLAKIIVPLAWPSIIIIFLYSMLGVWNDIIGPIVFLATPSLFPVTRGVYNFYGTNQSEAPLLAAAVVIVSLPVVALFVMSQRQLLRSAMGSGVRARPNEL